VTPEAGRNTPIEEPTVDNFTKHRLNDEAIRRAQERASHRKASHSLPGDPRRTSVGGPAASLQGRPQGETRITR